MSQIKIELNHKTVTANLITLNQYLKLLAAEQTEEYNKIFIDILGPYAYDKDLTKTDKEQILLVLLAKSLSQKNPISQYTCECGQVQNIELNYDHITQNIPSDNIIQNGLYPIKHIKLKIKPFTDLIETDIFTTIFSCIDGIYTANDIIKIEDLSDQEIENLISIITQDDINNIKNYLDQFYVQLAVPIKCACGKSNIYNLTGFKNCIEAIL